MVTCEAPQGPAKLLHLPSKCAVRRPSGCKPAQQAQRCCTALQSWPCWARSQAARLCRAGPAWLDLKLHGSGAGQGEPATQRQATGGQASGQEADNGGTPLGRDRCCPAWSSPLVLSAAQPACWAWLRPTQRTPTWKYRHMLRQMRLGPHEPLHARARCSMRTCFRVSACFRALLCFSLMEGA